jgi:hypothetical protein
MATDKKISDLPVASSINASDTSILLKNGTDYQFAFSTLLELIGAELTVGAAISFGSILPPNISGKNGDVFINTAAGAIAQRIAGTWTVFYSFPTGNTGDGTILYGTSVPGTVTGKNGDTFINTLSGIFYKKLTDTWSQVFSMQTGPAGATGPPGPTGAAGASGKTILSGTGVPSNLYTGTNGDYYINTATYVFYGPKTNGVWPAGFTLDNSEEEAIAAETAARVAADADLQGQVNNKIEAIEGYGLSQNNYTIAEKDKLANLSEHFKGNYTTAAVLATANPTGASGDYAFVDEGIGEDVKMYIWDENDNTWIISSGGGITPDATESSPGIMEIATTAEALNRSDDGRAMTALKTNALILDEKKKVSYQINPVGLNEVSILMENAGQVNSILISGADNAKLKIGLSATYPTDAQTYPFTYNAGDRIFITYNYTDFDHASCNIKLKCQDN